VSAAGPHRGVERDPAVCVTGPGRARVHRLPPAAGQRFSERRVPALLLQAGVQPQRVDPPAHGCRSTRREIPVHTATKHTHSTCMHTHTHTGH